MSGLAVALFEAYSRASGNPPDAHFDRNAAEQWMAQALEEVGVAELIRAAAWAEVSFNTVEGCYKRNPRNFMAAMAELDRDVVPLRTALARFKGENP